MGWFHSSLWLLEIGTSETGRDISVEVVIDTLWSTDRVQSSLGRRISFSSVRMTVDVGGYDREQGPLVTSYEKNQDQNPDTYHCGRNIALRLVPIGISSIIVGKSDRTSLECENLVSSRK